MTGQTVWIVLGVPQGDPEAGVLEVYNTAADAMEALRAWPAASIYRRQIQGDGARVYAPDGCGCWGAQVCNVCNPERIALHERLKELRGGQ